MLVLEYNLRPTPPRGVLPNILYSFRIFVSPTSQSHNQPSYLRHFSTQCRAVCELIRSYDTLRRIRISEEAGGGNDVIWFHDEVRTHEPEKQNGGVVITSTENGYAGALYFVKCTHI